MCDRGSSQQKVYSCGGHGPAAQGPFKGGLAAQMLGSGPAGTSSSWLLQGLPQLPYRAHPGWYTSQGIPWLGTERDRGIQTPPFGASMGHYTGQAMGRKWGGQEEHQWARHHCVCYIHTHTYSTAVNTNELFLSIWRNLTKIILSETSKLQKFIEKFKNVQKKSKYFSELYIHSKSRKIRTVNSGMSWPLRGRDRWD